MVVVGGVEWVGWGVRGGRRIAALPPARTTSSQPGEFRAAVRPAPSPHLWRHEVVGDLGGVSLLVPPLHLQQQRQRQQQQRGAHVQAAGWVWCARAGSSAGVQARGTARRLRPAARPQPGRKKGRLHPWVGAGGSRRPGGFVAAPRVERHSPATGPPINPKPSTHIRSWCRVAVLPLPSSWYSS